MIRATLDTNMLIKAHAPLEVNHDLCVYLINLHRKGLIQIQVVAANAAEYGRTLEGHSRSLKGDLKRLGFSDGDVKILPIILILDMAYVGYSYFADESLLSLMQDVWDAMFSPYPMDISKFNHYHNITVGDPNYPVLHRRWQNFTCDVLTVVEFIRDCQKAANDDICILITADEDDIIKNASKLQKLGAKHVLDLRSAVDLIDKSLEKSSV